MRPAYDVATVRAAEARLRAGLPPGALMQRAAAGLGRRCGVLLGRVYGARVVLLVGGGDNGADALWAGARLARRGARVDALCASSPDDLAGAALRGAGGRIVDAGSDEDGGLLARADLVVDGLVGIGGRGALRPPAARLAVLTNASAGTVVAVDLPSGVDADTGAVPGPAVQADVTVTFGTLKPGLLVLPGASYAGVVECVDLGLGAGLPPPTTGLLEAADVAAALPLLPLESTKYRRGVLGLAAGSQTYPGAAVLAAGGALAGGAGMVRYAGPSHPAEQVRLRWPETVVTEVSPGDGAAVLGAGRVQAWAVGPGLGTDEAAAAVLEAVLGAGLPTVVDADGLTLLASNPSWSHEQLLLTPHEGEFARFPGVGSPEGDRIGAVRELAARLGVTVLLKGGTTVVADPGGQVRVSRAGTPRLATAGSGDVLTGLCGALLAQGLSPLDAGAAGAFLHGLAGRLAAAGGMSEAGGAGGADAPVHAGQLVEALPAAFRLVAPGRPA